MTIIKKKNFVSIYINKQDEWFKTSV